MYAQAWTQFKTWNRLGGIGLIVGIVSIGAVAFLDDGAHGRPIAPRLGYILGGIGVLSILMFFYCWMRQQYFLCPRCGKCFSRGPMGFGMSMNPRRCLHCQLKLFADT